MEETRYSRSLRVHRPHFLIGLAISLGVTLLVAFNGFSFWIWQADVIDKLLSLAGVSHKLFTLGGLATFEVPIHHTPISPTTIVALAIVLLASILIVTMVRQIAPPVKAIWSIVAIAAILTLLWQTAVYPISSYTIHWVTIDWSCSGVINMCLVSLIYVPFLFTIKGPLWVKVSWLFIAVGFSIVWNLLRLSFVTATLYYFGGSVFLLFHYMVGAFVEFIYIVAFYSLGLAHLSKYEVGGVMRIGA